MTPEAQRTTDRYWLMMGETPYGPVEAAEIHARLATGEVSWQTLACPLGSSTWLPLVRIPGIGPPVQSPPSEGLQLTPPEPRSQPSQVPPSALPVEGIVLSPRRSCFGDAPGPSEQPRLPGPWNPVALAWWGLLFTPVWAGIMAAVNGKRLGSPRPAWIPLVIGLGCFGLYVAEEALIDSYILSVMLYLVGLLVLCGAVLQPQCELFTRWQTGSSGSTAGWVWPVLGGAPLALLAFGALVVGPLLPLEPREVCERFGRARTAKEAQAYCTLNMQPFLEAAFRQQQSSDSKDSFEFKQEGDAPAEMGGYLVGFRGLFYFPEKRRQTQIDGVFHLIKSSGWKIEDMYLVAVDHQQLEEPISVAHYYLLLQEQQPQPQQVAQPDPAYETTNQPQPRQLARPLAGSETSKGAPSKAKEWYSDPKVQAGAGRAASRLLVYEGGKPLMALLLAVGAGVAALFRRITRSKA